MLDIADDITVLRDGRVIRSGAAAVESPQTLIESMIGRPLAAAFPSKQYLEGGGRTMLEVSGLSGRGFHDVSLQVSPGEIVALTGLVGSGRTEVVRALFGADRSTSGTVLLDGSPYLRRKPWRSVERGIALLPESRKLEGLFLSFSISDNVSLASLKKFSRGGFVRPDVSGRLYLSGSPKWTSACATLRTPSGFFLAETSRRQCSRSRS
ncbi:sugar ABC transporter ATP-binding protein [Microbacterium oxydans]|nr:sugar ABC transporter ATP-binding protein [Microbacterium oxydans]